MQENKAAEAGPQKFKWWPDWRGKAAAIIASGPSAKKANLNLLRDRMKVIAIKANHELAPWADVVYGCDAHWWKHKRGLPEFAGVKIAYANGALDPYPDIRRLNIKPVTGILVDEPMTVGSGANSGFQALNLAVQFGAVRILLIGYDMTDEFGVHWYGRNNWPGGSNPMRQNFDRWRQCFQDVAPHLSKRGVEVATASPYGKLNCFKQMSVDQALAAWGL